MNYVLCGMMGAGKTTIAKSLSARTGRSWLDTDDVIAKKHGKISDIFASHGEGYFRDLETELSKSFDKQDGLIISTGGGFVLREENVRALKKNGIIIYLRARKETLVSRLKKDGERPLLEGETSIEEKVEGLLNARSSVYEKAADLVVDVDDKTPEKIAEEIIISVKNRA